MAVPGAPQTICFDLDGTLCTNTWGDYASAEPLPWAVDLVNELSEAGHRIIVHTARGTTTGIDWRPATEAQLTSWGVRYDELRFGKPQADVYVDDRTHHVDAWRSGVARSLDGGDPRVPILPPPRGDTLIEVGRTVRGRPYRLADHAAAVLARCPFPLDRDAGRIARELETVLAAAGDVPGDDDLVFTLGVSPPTHPAFADTLDGDAAPRLAAGVRRLGQFARGIRRWLRPEGIAAVTSGGDGWPLRPALPLPRDALGGSVAGIWGDALVLEPSGVAEAETAAAATAAGLRVDARPGDGPPDTLLLVAMPFVAVAVAEIDGRAQSTAPATTLCAALAERLGVDPLAQLQALAR